MRARVLAQLFYNCSIANTCIHHNIVVKCFKIFLKKDDARIELLTVG